MRRPTRPKSVHSPIGELGSDDLFVTEPVVEGKPEAEKVVSQSSVPVNIFGNQFFFFGMCSVKHASKDQDGAMYTANTSYSVGSEPICCQYCVRKSYLSMGVLQGGEKTEKLKKNLNSRLESGYFFFKLLVVWSVSGLHALLGHCQLDDAKKQVLATCR